MPEPLTLKAGEAVIDIGANVGVFTVWAASQFPEARIVAIEPWGPSFEILSENVRRNRLKQVEMMQSACGGKAGAVFLHERGPASMNTLYTRDVLRSSFRPLDTVPIVTLDEIFAKFNLDCAGLLKLDCEGAEYDILLNASDDILRRVKHLAIEYHLGLNDGTPESLGEFLGKKGFDVTVLPPRSEEDGYMYAKNLR